MIDVKMDNISEVTLKKQGVRQMFGAIAGTYDFLNHLLSLNRDHAWRRRAAKLADLRPGERLLDLCCGTGDVAIAFREAQPALAEITGVDFSPEMLELAEKKAGGWRLEAGGNPQSKIQNRKSEIPPDANRCKQLEIQWLCADAENLPLPDNAYDCVSCAFGIRNLGDPARGLAEVARVLKPGGRAVILEFAPPANPLMRRVYNAYFRRLLPLIGNLISRSTAYDYLPQSVGAFHAAELLPRLFQENRLRLDRRETHNLGGVLIFVAIKT